MRLAQTGRAASGRPSHMPESRSRAGANSSGKTQTRRARNGGSRPIWRSRRAGLFSSGWLGLLRMRRNGALLLAVGLGILVAVVLIGAVPLYNTAVTNIELQHELSAAGVPARNIEVRVETSAVSADLRATNDARITPLAQRYLASFTAPAPSYFVVTDATILTAAGAQTFNPASDSTPQVRFQGFDYATAASHMRFVQGGPPSAVASGATPQAAIIKEMADDLGLTVGSHLSVTAFGNHTYSLTATVSGIWTPNQQDPYWNALSFSTDGPNVKIYPVQLTFDDLFANLSAFPGLSMAQHWVYYTQPERINTNNLDAVRDDQGRFQSEVNGVVVGTRRVSRILVLSALQQTLDAVVQQQALLALPLYAMVAQIVVLALLFVGSMAGLLIERQSQEIAVLKSRGASNLQTLMVFTSQGALVGLVAFALGPFLSGLLAVSLIRWFIPPTVLQDAGVSASYLATLITPQAALLPAAAAALLGVGAVAAAGLRWARLDVLGFRRDQARPSRQPFWRRYYLDVALALLCGAGYLDLDQFGVTGARLQLNSGPSPLLLLAPALLLLAGALLALRLVPLAAALGARLAARGRGLISMLALAQIERSPGRYSRMTLLLMLAVGLGLFAVTFDASLLQNASDSAAYSVGADVRLQMREPETVDQGHAALAQFASIPGVQAATRIYRGSASATFDEGGLRTDLLGVDPASFAQVSQATSWRSDYASKPLAALLGELHANAHGQTAGGPDAPIFALVSQTFAGNLSLRVGDRFALQLDDTTLSATSFVVGEIVSEFPTLYPTHAAEGFVVVGLDDYLDTITANSTTAQVGPNEYWLKTTNASRQHAALLNTLATPSQTPEANVLNVYDLREQALAAQSHPVGAGIRGLLEVGAITAVLLAVLGSVIQSLLATQQRATQFAILRTLGTARRQLAGLLLSEQIVVYLFGVVGGTLLGLLLTTATLPFLQFSDTLVDPSRIGVPPYQLVFNPTGMLAFYAALLGAFALALLIAARYAATIGLGQALRLGED